jgi:hypothetical protein
MIDGKIAAISGVEGKLMRAPILGLFMKRSQGIEMRTVMDASVEAKSPQDYRRENRPIRRSLASLFLCAGVACIGSAQLSAQAPASDLWSLSRTGRQSMTWSTMSPGLRTPIYRPVKDSDFRCAREPTP